MFCVALQGDAWGGASAGGLSASGLGGPAGAADFASAVPPSFESGAAGGFGAAPDFGGGGVTLS